VHCLLSNADTPLMHELYAGFHIDVIPAKRAINSNAAARGAVNEVLIRNW
jgi:DNA adenine methylase